MGADSVLKKLGESEIHIERRTQNSNSTAGSPTITFSIPQIEGYTYQFSAISSVDYTGDFDIKSPMNIYFTEQDGSVKVTASKRGTNYSSYITVTMMFVYFKN